jgi:hypothetical protein
MCEPTTLMVGMMAISAASTAIQYMDQKQAAEGQEAIIQDGYAQEQQQTLRQYQENTSVAQENTSDRHKEQLVEEGRLKAIGAESGLQGVSNDRQVADANNQGDKDIATIFANLQRSNEQVHSGGMSKQSSANIQMAGVKRPSGLGAGLQIAGAAVNAYSAYSKPVTNSQGSNGK